MLVKKLIPLKFLAGCLIIVIAGVLLSTSQVYPTKNNTSSSSFVIGCVLIIIFTIIQNLFTIIGVNIYDRRIHFENMVFNWVGVGILVWFALSAWQRQYIWYVWGLLSVYPLFNQFAAFISVLCHNKKIVFEKFRAQA